MGVWGVGLYSGDFAMDLRSAIKAVARLPFDGERLVEILSETAPAVADNPSDEDHTTFWLVVADQFAKRGIISDRARTEALQIIDADSDLAMRAALGMKTSDLSKRRKMLQDLRARLTAPPVSKPRSVLKKPQAFLMNVGDMVVYPTCRWKVRQSLLCLEGAGQGHDSDRLETGWVVSLRRRRSRTCVRFPVLVPATDTHDSDGPEADPRGVAGRCALEIGKGWNLFPGSFQADGAGKNRHIADRHGQVEALAPFHAARDTRGDRRCFDCQRIERRFPQRGGALAQARFDDSGH